MTDTAEASTPSRIKCMTCDHNEWLASIEATTRPDAPPPLECDRHPKEDTNAQDVG